MNGEISEIRQIQHRSIRQGTEMNTQTLPLSNVTIRQVQRLRDNYEALCQKGIAIVAAYDNHPSTENLQAMVEHVHAVDLAYKLWDQAHKECYGV